MGNAPYKFVDLHPKEITSRHVKEYVANIGIAYVKHANLMYHYEVDGMFLFLWKEDGWVSNDLFGNLKITGMEKTVLRHHWSYAHAYWVKNYDLPDVSFHSLKKTAWWRNLALVEVISLVLVRN